MKAQNDKHCSYCQWCYSHNGKCVKQYIIEDG